MDILVTGGAGYIGSHAVRQLIDTGHKVAVLDNFYSGHRWAIPKDVKLFEGNCGDVQLLEVALSQFRFEAVMHFAAHTEVEESVKNPEKYYKNNTENTKMLVGFCLQNGINRFIFSSTAAVYGPTQENFAVETTPLHPVNPYGESKMLSEKIILDAASANPNFKYIILRYFNVAGASLDGKLGQSTPKATQLIKVACEVAVGKRNQIQIFGTDYDTADGTCIRDYIHVEDLVSAHILALEHLNDRGHSDIYNCGYGRGYSVKEVIQMVERVSGKKLNVVIAPRRAGDLACLYSDSTKIQNQLGWKPQFNDLEIICRTAYEWEKNQNVR